jgi:NADPH2:quinone reductase
MKAIQVQKYGGPEVLTLVDLDVPKANPNQAIVQIKAAGVNYIDVYFREGKYPATPPFVDGQEGAGVVTELGSEVKGLKVGDRVAYTGVLGSYAEYAAVPGDRLVKIPEKLDFRAAAAAMLQGTTAHYLCRTTYPLKRGDIALVHAAAGGVGLLLLQMSKKLGARVIGTVSTEEKAKLAREAGADDTILYTQQDFEVETKRLTDGKGVHVIYDGVGKDTFEKGLNSLRPRGYLVYYGASSGPVPPFDINKLGPKGSLFVTRPTLLHHIASREDLEQRSGDVLGAIATGELKLRIEHVYPLKNAEQAHRDLEGRKTTGKLLLIP